ncbi:hypothetical protein ABW19_dt0209123 [Dactylella cylindrospora]|nr:hypothetical protein ABW19_dt0209123 [Dactylella cylindrospora]
MVLKTVRQVISGVTARSGSRNIPRFNARYLTQLGEDCIEIMKILGFIPDGEELVPPVLPPEEGTPWQDELAKTLDDWDAELQILASECDMGNTYTPIRADNEFRKLLGFTNYESTSRRLVVDLTQPEHPMYASLGAQSDFSDNLLSWAFQRQKECDPKNSPYYFECLTDLANGRKSEDLQLQVATLRSQGEFTSSDVRDAYRGLGLTPGAKDENLIIGTFHARLSDAPKHEASLKEYLNLIGRAIGNQNIIHVSQQVTMNLQQAYSKLNLTPESDSDYIQTVFQLTLNEKGGDENTLWTALKLIAESRKDHRLLSLVDSHEAGFEIMDYETALNRLGVNGNMPDDTVIAVYEISVKDFPSQLSTLRGALKVIADRRNSRALQHYVVTGNKDLLTRGTNDWPVGIENIGNTCYLNSLLQFYFTITPLRELILDIENHQEGEISDEELERKRIGGRKVTRGEIEQAKAFAHYLRNLFNDMITSHGTSVRPESPLPRLALNSVREEPSEKVQSPLEDENQVEIGPALPPGMIRGAQDEENQLPFSLMDLDPKPPQRQLHVVNDDRSSEGTLVGDGQDPPAYDDQGYILVEGQNIGGKEDTTALVEHLEKQAQKTELLHVQQTDSQATDAMSIEDESTVPLLQREADDAMEDVPEVKESETILKLLPPIPDRPPPVPPRPVQKPARKDSNFFSFGRQQDVTECIQNVMFQIEAALKPEGFDSDGEQLDIIKNLFYIKTTQTLEFATSSETRHKEERSLHFIVDVAENGRDIYTALDSHFDASIVELEGKQARRYLSISTLPPILQIQIQRVQFNRETKQPYKSNAPLHFGEKIFLDRYMASDDKALLARREQSWKWKEELEKLERRRAELLVKVEGLELPEMMEATRMYLEEIDQIMGEEDDMIVVPPNLLVSLEENKDRVTAELRDVKDRIKELTSNIAQQFTDLRKYGYRIHSIFIHKGSVNFGHYWIYIYDYQAGVYRKYNDGSVTKPIDDDEMYKMGDDKKDINPPNPYFLVYVREDQTDMMQAVCRHISEQGAPPLGSGNGEDNFIVGQEIIDYPKGG